MDILGLLLKNDKIYIPPANNLQIHILQYHHDYILTGHFRQNKILKLIYHNYTWLALYVNVKKFRNSCINCMRSKLQCHKPYRILKQLLVPKQPWNLISMNFTEKLPFSSGCNTILAIINQLSKQAIFFLTVDTITLHELAKLFIIHVFSKHSILSHITSNHESKFVSNFFWSLKTTLDM